MDDPKDPHDARGVIDLVHDPEMADTVSEEGVARPFDGLDAFASRSRVALQSGERREDSLMLDPLELVERALRLATELDAHALARKP